MASYETQRNKQAVVRVVIAEGLKRKAVRLAILDRRSLSAFIRLLIEKAVAEAEAAAKA
jgi:hypothetical protein